MTSWTRLAGPPLASFLIACSSDPAATPNGTSEPVLLTEAERMDPEACVSCHPNHVTEWSASMHAHASSDPVFLAMNKRGQEETGGALGDFCVKCHAPVALALGLTKNGDGLESLPKYAQGVTCYFCHSVAAVSEDHNNGLLLADDDALRGPIERPVKGAPHRMKYSALHDRLRPESSDLCGSCHDVVLDNGLKLERTALEWRASAFAPGQALTETAVATCTGCHMPRKGTPSVVKSPAFHTGHDHHMAAVDVDLGGTDDALIAQQRALVTELLDTSLGVEICVEPTGPAQSAIYVMLENSSSGHFFPSGASHDRRVWVEVTAYDTSGTVLYSSGGAAPDEGGDADPDLWSLGDVALKEDRTAAHMFWDIASIEPHGLPAPVTFDKSSPDAVLHHVTRRFPRSRTATVAGVVARVSVTARFRPIGFDVLDDLVGSGHLDRTLRDAMPTFDIIPNRHLGSHPTLSALAGETFEWSNAVIASGVFQAYKVNGTFQKSCVSTSARR
jgi:hypothetical protein